ncbi:unnamed protein product [Effrenium voratum]|nr:unnamed protein product [Effrenium voratum]
MLCSSEGGTEGGFLDEGQATQVYHDPDLDPPTTEACCDAARGDCAANSDVVQCGTSSAVSRPEVPKFADTEQSSAPKPGPADAPSAAVEPADPSDPKQAKQARSSASPKKTRTSRKSVRQVSVMTQTCAEDVALVKAEPISPRMKRPRLSLLLPKRPKAANPDRAVDAPGSYAASTEALWNGKTPRKAAHLSLRELLAAKREEADEPLLRSGSFGRWGGGRRESGGQLAPVKEEPRSGPGAGSRRSRSPLTPEAPYPAKTETHSAGGASGQLGQDPVVRCLNFDDSQPAWLRQVQALHGSKSAAGQQGRPSFGELPTPCRDRRQSLSPGKATGTPPTEPESPTEPGSPEAPTNISQPAREAVDHERPEDSPDEDEDEESEEHGQPEREVSGRTHENQAEATFAKTSARAEACRNISPAPATVAANAEDAEDAEDEDTEDAEDAENAEDGEPAENERPTDAAVQAEEEEEEAAEDAEDAEDSEDGEPAANRKPAEDAAVQAREEETEEAAVGKADMASDLAADANPSENMDKAADFNDTETDEELYASKSVAAVNISPPVIATAEDASAEDASPAEDADRAETEDVECPEKFDAQIAEKLAEAEDAEEAEEAEAENVAEAKDAEDAEEAEADNVAEAEAKDAEEEATDAEEAEAKDAAEAEDAPVLEAAAEDGDKQGLSLSKQPAGVRQQAERANAESEQAKPVSKEAREAAVDPRSVEHLLSPDTESEEEAQDAAASKARAIPEDAGWETMEPASLRNPGEETEEADDSPWELLPAPGKRVAEQEEVRPKKAAKQALAKTTQEEQEAADAMAPDAHGDSASPAESEEASQLEPLAAPVALSDEVPKLEVAEPSFAQTTEEAQAEAAPAFAKTTQEALAEAAAQAEAAAAPAVPQAWRWCESCPKPPVKRTAAKSRARNSSTATWQRPLPADLGGPPGLDPVPEAPKPKAKAKAKARSSAKAEAKARPTAKAEAKASAGKRKREASNADERAAPPRAALADDDSVEPVKKRRATAPAKLTAAKSSAKAKAKPKAAPKASKQAKVEKPKAPSKARKTGAKESKIKLTSDAFASPAEAAVASAVGRPVFATTGLELSSRQKRLLLDLHGVLVADWVPQISHVIADTFRRTTKMMCAICKGAQIVTPAYVKASREAGRLVDETPFLLKDELCEAAFARKRGLGGYSLAGALQLARKKGPLLRGMSVYCFPSVGEKRELPLLVSAAGGTWLKRFPLQPSDPSVLLLAERSVSSERELKRRKLFEVYDVELLREAACTQELRRAAYRL